MKFTKAILLTIKNNLTKKLTKHKVQYMGLSGTGPDQYLSIHTKHNSPWSLAIAIIKIEQNNLTLTQRTKPTTNLAGEKWEQTIKNDMNTININSFIQNTIKNLEP